MTPNDRELALHARIEKLEKALAIANEGLKNICADKLPWTKEGLMRLATQALEKIEKEMG